MCILKALPCVQQRPYPPSTRYIISIGATVADCNIIICDDFIIYGDYWRSDDGADGTLLLYLGQCFLRPVYCN